MTGTGGLRRLTKDFVLNYPVSLPPLDEQKKIVSQTEEEIAIVEQNKRLIEIFEKKINDKTAVKISGRKRQSARNTLKQKVYKDIEHHDE